MSQRNDKSAPKPEPEQKVQVARPKLEAFATSLTVSKSRHNAIGDCCTMIVEAGDLAIVVHFPIQAAGDVGKQMVGLSSGIVIPQGSDINGLNGAGE